MSTAPAPAAPSGPQPVWDRFVRAFHWSLVACVLLNYAVLGDGEQWHQWLGYTATALVLTRCVWGFIGTTHARFASFSPTPARLAGRLRRGVGAVAAPGRQQDAGAGAHRARRAR